MRKILVIVLSLVLAASAAAQSKLLVVPDAGTLSVFASNNRLVGVFAAAPSGSSGDVGGLVRMDVIGEGVIFIAVKRTPAGLTWGGPDVYFTTTDCSGRGYGRELTTVGDRAAWVGLEGRLYIWTPGDYSEATITGPTLRSRASVDEEKGVRVCRPESIHSSGWVPLREVAKLNEDFPPPLSLEPTGRAVRAARH
jgi:hypothetical protein